MEIVLGKKTKIKFVIGDSQHECRRFTFGEQMAFEKAAKEQDVPAMVAIVEQCGMPKTVLESLDMEDVEKVLSAIAGKLKA